MSDEAKPPFQEIGTHGREGVGTSETTRPAADVIVATPAVPPGGPRCPRCGDRLEAGTARCPACGAFQPGNSAARTSGIYARQQPGDLRMSADDLMAGIVSDLGGEAEMSTLQRSYAKKIGDVEIVCGLLVNDLARNGIMTASGAKVRDSYDKLLAGLALFDRLAQRIGMERRPRPVASLGEILAKAREARQ